jgi:Cytochrome C oxidase, cbb3-type, subunit III
MSMKNQVGRVIFVSCICATILFSCGKNDGTITPPDPCSGVNITVTGTTTNSSACLNDGGITITASGSSGLQYSIDGITFQSSNVFTNLAKGTYTVTARNANNCKQTSQFTVNEGSSTPGPQFTEVKQLIQANCVSCHAPGGQQPNPNFTVDCNIVQFATLINTRVVVLGTMPPTGPLSQTDKNKITTWINGGGKITN